MSNLINAVKASWFANGRFWLWRLFFLFSFISCRVTIYLGPGRIYISVFKSYTKLYLPNRLYPSILIILYNDTLMHVSRFIMGLKLALNQNRSSNTILWDKVFKNGPSKVCGRQPSKKVKWYGLFLTHRINSNNFEGCLPQILLGPFLNTLSHIHLTNICPLNNLNQFQNWPLKWTQILTY